MEFSFGPVIVKKPPTEKWLSDNIGYWYQDYIFVQNRMFGPWEWWFKTSEDMVLFQLTWATT